LYEQFKKHSYIFRWAGITQLVSDSVRAGRSGDRIPVRARYSATVQTGPETHPATYTMDTGSFLGLKRPGRGVDHPPHLTPRLRKKESYTSTSLWVFMVCSRVNLLLPLATSFGLFQAICVVLRVPFIFLYFIH
jgi:hypothetical protein